MTSPSPVSPASPLFLREDEVRRGLEMLHFGHGALNRSIDALLAERGLGHAHHRALYFISRQPDLTVTDLLRILSVTKQSLGRVLGDLEQHGLVESRPGQRDRRQRLLRLSPAGAALEAELFRLQREKLASAYAQAGQGSVTGFWRVLEGLIPEGDRAMVQGLRGGG